MNTKKGFTMLEIMIASVVMAGLVIIFFLQKNNVDAMQRDEKRKIAINAMYYALEEGYYEQNNAYPENIKDTKVLPWIDPNLFTDPNGYNLWVKDSDYSYQPTGCEDGRCKSYTLKATMEKEDDYIKASRH